MRPKTVCAVDRLNKLLDDEDFAAMVSADMWLVGFSRYKNNMHVLTADDIQTIRSLLRKLPAAEEALTRGGLVLDDNRRWCSHGDRVRFKRGRNAEDTAEEWSHGELCYGDADCMWYILGDESGGGECFRLGSAWEEVSAWEYEAVQGGKQ